MLTYEKKLQSVPARTLIFLCFVREVYKEKQSTYLLQYSYVRVDSFIIDFLYLVQKKKKKVRCHCTDVTALRKNHHYPSKFQEKNHFVLYINTSQELLFSQTNIYYVNFQEMNCLLGKEANFLVKNITDKIFSSV